MDDLENKGFFHTHSLIVRSLNYITTLFYKHPCRHKTWAQCWSSVDPPSTMLAQRWSGVVHMSRPCWHVIQGHLCNILCVMVDRIWCNTTQRTQTLRDLVKLKKFKNPRKTRIGQTTPTHPPFHFSEKKSELELDPPTHCRVFFRIFGFVLT